MSTFDEFEIAIDTTPAPGGMTNLAAAMCHAASEVFMLSGTYRYVYTYTDGNENYSFDYEFDFPCSGCAAYFPPSSPTRNWPDGCIPPGYPGHECSDAQNCVYDAIVGVPAYVNRYFGYEYDVPKSGMKRSNILYDVVDSSGNNADYLWLEALSQTSGGGIVGITDEYMDADADSVEDFLDNCPQTYNPSQIDSDGDGIGDACEPTCCHLRSDINHNGTGPDIADLVYLVNYMFNGGPPPPCQNPPGSGNYLEADINGDGSGPDISDLVYLVNFMFNGGPWPIPCP